MKMMKMNECWAKPSSIYMLEVRHWSCCPPPTSKVRERAVNAAGKARLARMWASANIRHYIEASYSGKRIPPLHCFKN